MGDTVVGAAWKLASPVSGVLFPRSLVACFSHVVEVAEAAAGDAGTGHRALLLGDCLPRTQPLRRGETRLRARSAFIGTYKHDVFEGVSRVQCAQQTDSASRVFCVYAPLRLTYGSCLGGRDNGFSVGL